jgi:hypothetical protein
VHDAVNFVACRPGLDRRRANVEDLPRHPADLRVNDDGRRGQDYCFSAN